MDRFKCEDFEALSFTQGFQIPKGWQIVYSIRYTHEEAAGKILHTGTKTDFEPKEYDHRNCDKTSSSKQATTTKPSSSSNFIPFGKGARMCAGKNYGLLFLRIFLFELVRTVDVSLCTEASIETQPMMRASNSVKVVVKPRVL